MNFSNPQIIKSSEDVIIGSISFNKSEVSYFEYKSAVYKHILKVVVAKVKESMANGNSHADAIKEVVEYIYSYLNFAQKSYPSTEELIVDEIMASHEFKKWDTDIYYRFMSIHEGVVNKNTPIPVSGVSENQNLAEFYTDVMDYDFYDLIEALSSSFNL